MNIHKNRARSAVHKAVKKGQLIKEPCEICGNPETAAHHYLGYDEEHWLSIKWLCSTHHVAAHSGSYFPKERTGETTAYVPEKRTQTLLYLRIAQLLRKGLKPQEIRRKTGASYMYVWKIKRVLQKEKLLK